MGGYPTDVLKLALSPPRTSRKTSPGFADMPTGKQNPPLFQEHAESARIEKDKSPERGRSKRRKAQKDGKTKRREIDGERFLHL